MCTNFLTIPGPAGNLEAHILEPSPNTSIGIVLCHPHPGFGGTMSFPLIREIFHSMGTAGYCTMRFNFRGVGQSEGISGNGAGEIEDLRSVCTFMCRTHPDLTKILLIGYSFGAAISVAMVNQLPTICGVVAISPPFEMLSPYFRDKAITKPKLFIIGSRDDFTPLDTFKASIGKFSEPKTSFIVPDEDHFWSGHEALICEKILDWVQLTYPNP